MLITNIGIFSCNARTSITLFLKDQPYQLFLLITYITHAKSLHKSTLNVNPRMGTLTPNMLPLSWENLV